MNNQYILADSKSILDEDEYYNYYCNHCKIEIGWHHKCPNSFLLNYLDIIDKNENDIIDIDIEEIKEIKEEFKKSFTKIICKLRSENEIYRENDTINIKNINKL